MKKRSLFLIIFLIIMVSVLTACGESDEIADVGIEAEQTVQEEQPAEQQEEQPTEADTHEQSSEGTVVITERFFVNQVLEVFMNPDIYLGRTIQYEGIFYNLGQGGEDAFVVMRYTFGCCGIDGRIGFQLVLDGTEPLPDDTWVEVSGILEMNYGFLMVRVVSLIEKDERGSDMVV